MQTIVINNTAFPVGIQVEHGKKEGLIQLSPGVNSVESEAWTKAKSSPQVTKMLGLRLEKKHVGDAAPEQIGKLMIVEGKTSKGSDGFSLGTLEQVLPDVLDRRVLERWLADETRAPAKKLIEARAAELDRIAAEAKKGGK